MAASSTKPAPPARLPADHPLRRSAAAADAYSGANAWQRPTNGWYKRVVVKRVVQTGGCQTGGTNGWYKRVVQTGVADKRLVPHLAVAAPRHEELEEHERGRRRLDHRCEAGRAEHQDERPVVQAHLRAGSKSAGSERTARGATAHAWEHAWERRLSPAAPPSLVREQRV